MIPLKKATAETRSEPPFLGKDTDQLWHNKF